MFEFVDELPGFFPKAPQGFESSPLTQDMRPRCHRPNHSFQALQISFLASPVTHNISTKKYSSEMLKRSSNILFKRHLANLLAPRCSNYLPISDLLSSFLNFTLPFTNRAFWMGPILLFLIDTLP